MKGDHGKAESIGGHAHLLLDEKKGALRTTTLLIVVTNADLAGAPIHVSSLARGVRPHLNRIVVVFGEEGPVRQRLLELGIETFVIPTIRSNFNFVQDVSSIRSVCGLVKRIKPDLIHLHSSKAGMVGRIAGAICRVPTVYTVHGWGFGPGRKRGTSTIVRAIERMLRPFTGGYIAVSEADRALGIRDLALAPDRIRTVRNGIPFEPSRTAPLAPKVVMVARDCYPKDYETLFRALEGLECEVICVGAGTDTDDFLRRASSVAPTAAAKLSARGQQDDVRPSLHEAGIFVLSSRFEGLPLCVIEAMRAGMAIVAADVGGMRELVEDGISGMLFPAGDARKLREHIATLLRDANQRSALGEAARRRFEREFTTDSMINETLAEYSRVLSSPK